MSVIARRVAIMSLLVIIVPAWAAAQSASRLHRIEVAGGVGVLMGAALGSQNADLRTATTGQPYRLFSSRTRMSAAPILDLRLGVPLRRRYAVEAHTAFGHPEIRSAVSSDAEHAPDLIAVERLDQYVFDGGLVVGLDRWSVAGLHPFVTAGGGYVRQLHEGLVVIEDGRVFFAGGGVKHTIHARPRGLIRGIGARADSRLNWLSGGIHIDENVRRHVSVSGSLFVVF
jgi:hypothetical protein